MDDNYYYFEITEDGDEVTVENKAGVGFVNKPTTGELEITKKDVATGKPLPKAGFRIKDADGKVVAEVIPTRTASPDSSSARASIPMRNSTLPRAISSTPHRMSLNSPRTVRSSRRR